MKDEMCKAYADRIQFLNALLDYASCSNTFNPYFHRAEMMKILGITEREFNIMQHNLGERYCHIVDIHDGDNRYAIITSECWQLRDQLEQGRLHSEHSSLLRENNTVHIEHMKSEKKLLRMTIVLAILTGTLLIVAFAQLYKMFFP